MLTLYCLAGQERSIQGGSGDANPQQASWDPGFVSPAKGERKAPRGEGLPQGQSPLARLGRKQARTSSNTGSGSAGAARGGPSLPTPVQAAWGTAGPCGVAWTECAGRQPRHRSRG